MTSYSFSKKLKLLTRKNFSYVFEKPIKLIRKEIICVCRVNNKNYPRIGLIIPKKNIVKSHDRNRIKRLIRETFRLSRNKLSYMDFVIIVKKESILLNNVKFLNLLDNLWRNYYQC